MAIFNLKNTWTTKILMIVEVSFLTKFQSSFGYYFLWFLFDNQMVIIRLQSLFHLYFHKKKQPRKFRNKSTLLSRWKRSNDIIIWCVCVCACRDRHAADGHGRGSRGAGPPLGIDHRRRHKHNLNLNLKAKTNTKIDFIFTWVQLKKLILKIYNYILYRYYIYRIQKYLKHCVIQRDNGGTYLNNY